MDAGPGGNELDLTSLVGIILLIGLTLYTTPVVFVYMEHLRAKVSRKTASFRLRHAGTPPPLSGP